MSLNCNNILEDVWDGVDELVDCPDPNSPRKIYCTRYNALIKEICKFECQIDMTVARAETIKNMVRCLRKFAHKQYTFFVAGFYTKAGLDLKEKPSELLRAVTKEYVFGRIIEQISADFIIIRHAYWSRANGTEKEKKALEVADQLSYEALEPAMKKNNTGKGLISNDTTVLCYFQKVPQVRVIPYAPVAVIGIPVTCIEDEKNHRDFLATPHEVGHYIYWHGRFGEQCKAFKKFIDLSSVDEPSSEDGTDSNTNVDTRMSFATFRVVNATIDQLPQQNPDVLSLYRASGYASINTPPSLRQPDIALDGLRTTSVQIIAQSIIGGGLSTQLNYEFLTEFFGIVAEGVEGQNDLLKSKLQEAIVEKNLEGLKDLLENEISVDGSNLDEYVNRHLIGWESRMTRVFEEEDNVQLEVLNHLPDYLNPTTFIQSGVEGIREGLEFTFTGNLPNSVELELDKLRLLEEALILEGAEELKAYFGHWKEEIFCDVYGALVSGTEISFRMQELLFDNYNLLGEDDHHPTSVVRPYIYTKTIASIESTNLTTEATKLNGRWAAKIASRDYVATVPLPNKLETGDQLKIILESIVEHLLLLFKKCGVLIKADSSNPSKYARNALAIWSDQDPDFLDPISGQKYNQLLTKIKDIKNGTTPLSYSELGGGCNTVEFYFDKLFSDWKSGNPPVLTIEYEVDNPAGGWVRTITKSGWTIGGPEDDGETGIK